MERCWILLGLDSYVAMSKLMSKTMNIGKETYQENGEA